MYQLLILISISIPLSKHLHAAEHSTCIVLSHKFPGWLEKHAAEKWAKYAKLLTGREFPIFSQFDLPKNFDRYVLLDVKGNNWNATRLHVRSRKQTLHEHGFFIKSLSENGASILAISGNSPPALLYGVYHYFEKICHVGFFVDGEYIPSLDKLPMSDIDIEEAPIFSRRDAVCGSTWWNLRPRSSEEINFRYEWAMKKKLTHTLALGETDPPDLAKRLGIEPGGGVRDFDRRARMQERPDPANLPKNTPEIYPKALGSDGFSTWRGPNLYPHWHVIEDREDMIKVTRLSYSDLFEKKIGEDDAHLFLRVGSTESGEFAHLEDLFSEVTFQLQRERDPLAVMFVYTYGAGNWEKLGSLGIEMLVQDFENGAAAFVPKDLWSEAGRFKLYNYFSGAKFMYALSTSGMDEYFRLPPGTRELIEQLQYLASDPMAANCIGTDTYLDAMQIWWLQDLYAELGWNPHKVTFDSWIEDFPLRRFGRDSLKNMKESFRHFIETGDSTCTGMGYNRYINGARTAWKWSESFWYDNVKRDWHAYTDGTRYVDGFLKSLRAAMKEKERQKDNHLYDLYLVDVYHEFCRQLFKMPLIRFHHNYFMATEMLKKGNNRDAEAAIKKLEQNGKRLDLVLETMEKVFSTCNEWCHHTAHYTPRKKNGRPVFEGVEIHNQPYGGIYWEQNPVDTFEQMHFLFRPAVQVMVEAVLERLKSGNAEIVPQTHHHPFYPHPDKVYGYFHPASTDPVIRQKEIAVVQRWYESDLDIPHFPGTTAEAIEDGLHRLAAADCLDFGDMKTEEMILKNFPLSNPQYHAWTYRPVRIESGGKGVWNESHYVLQPLFRGHQSLHHGPFLGEWFSLEDVPGEDAYPDHIELSFTYHHATTRKHDTGTEPSYVRLSLQMEDVVVGSLTFYNDGRKAPQPELLKADGTQKEYRLVGGPFDNTVGRDKASAGRDTSESQEAYRGRIIYEPGRVIVSSDEFKETFAVKVNRKFRRGALLISSYYPEQGPGVEVWVKDLSINGQKITLYDVDRKR